MLSDEDSGPSGGVWRLGRRVISRGEFWTVDAIERGEGCCALRLSARLDPTTRRTLLAPFDRIRPAPESRHLALVRLRRWVAGIRNLSATLHPAGTLGTAAWAGIRLMPYQLEPALAIVRHGATRLLIADEVGLGKTVQAGLIAAELAARRPSFRALILLPAGLREQWHGELARLFNLQCTAADASWLRAITANRPTHVNPWGLPGIYLASFDFVKRPEVLRPLEDVRWDLFVMDEAHAASAMSDRRAAAHALACRAAYVVLLTATPPVDVPQQHQSLCGIGQVEKTDPILVFRRTRHGLGNARPRKSTLLSIRPTEAEVRMHQLLEEYTRQVWREASQRNDEGARLAAVILRKRALSSAASLANSVRRRMALLVGDAPAAGEQLSLPLGDEDPLADEEPLGALAAPGLADTSRERRWLAIIAESATRAALDESKIRFLRRFLVRVREPVIVFTEYRDTLQRLRTTLTRPPRKLLVLHGGMTPAERSRVQLEFNATTRSEPSQAGAVLLATDAASEGLNLHMSCRSVVHYELPWSTSRLEQRAGRVDRVGQTQRVHENALVFASTAERLVLAPLLRRAVRVRQDAPGHAGMAGPLTESHAAELIVGNGQLPTLQVPPTQRGHTRAADFREDAGRELERLTGVRGLSAGARREAWVPAESDRPLAAVVRRRHSALTRGIVLVFRVALSDSDARQFHRDAIVISCPLRIPLAGKLAARNIRRIVESFTVDGRSDLHAILSKEIFRTIDAASSIHIAAHAAVSRRTESMRRRTSITAQRLAQSGLFERRITSTPAAAHGILPESMSMRPLSFASSVDVSLAAALVVF